MAELSTGQPLFPGDSDIDQLYIVQKMLGARWAALLPASCTLPPSGRHAHNPVPKAAIHCPGCDKAPARFLNMYVVCVCPLLPAGPLCRQHDILFLKNSRFAGLKFPDMSHPMTLDAKFHSVLPADALDFLK